MADLGEAGAAGRRPGKSAAAFRTISEVADELDVPQHVLRFWETKFPQIRPLKRGGGRRYYRPEDVELLSRIRALLYQEGYTIRGVQRLLREGGLKPGGARPADLGPHADDDHGLEGEADLDPQGEAGGDAGHEAEAGAEGGLGRELSIQTRSVLEEILDELVQARQALPPRRPKQG